MTAAVYTQPAVSVSAGTQVVPSAGIHIPAGLYRSIKATLDVGAFSTSDRLSGTLLISVDNGVTWQPDGGMVTFGGSGMTLDGQTTTLRSVFSGNLDLARQTFLKTQAMLMAIEFTAPVPGTLSYTLEFTP